MVIETCKFLSFEDWPPALPPTQKYKFKFSFPFHRLPLLAQIQVIRTMDAEDWITFVVTSKRNERVMKLARIKMESPCVEISLDTCIKFSSLKLNLCYDKMFWKARKTWPNVSSISVIEQAAKLYQKTRNIFVFSNSLKISFCTDIPQKATIRELQSNPVLKNWTDLTITGEKISSEDLKMILDTATSGRLIFRSEVKEMPLDFKHENAFKFFGQIYSDARWVKMEDLYGLKLAENMALGLNSFTEEQLKSFVNHWVESDVDMFLWLNIKSTERLSFESLVDGLLGIQGSHPTDQLFFTLPKSSSSTRKGHMLIMNYHATTKNLMLITCEQSERYAHSRNEEENKKFENVGKILTLLHKKKELENLWEVASGETKMELSRKINDSIAELSALDVIFIDGKVFHELF